MVKLDLGGALWRRRNVISSYEISWGFLMGISLHSTAECRNQLSLFPSRQKRLRGVTNGNYHGRKKTNHLIQCDLLTSATTGLILKTSKERLIQFKLLGNLHISLFFSHFIFKYIYLLIKSQNVLIYIHFIQVEQL